MTKKTFAEIECGDAAVRRIIPQDEVGQVNGLQCDVVGQGLSYADAYKLQHRFTEADLEATRRAIAVAAQRTKEIEDYNEWLRQQWAQEIRYPKH